MWLRKIGHLVTMTVGVSLASILVTTGCNPAPPPPSTTDNGEPSGPPTAHRPDTKPDQLEIVGIVPLDGEPVQDRVVFFFDAGVFVSGERASAPPFRFDPPMMGQYRVDGNFAAFEAYEPFVRDTIYTITLNEDLVSEDGARIPEVHRTHRFASSQFEPRRMWEIEEQPDRLVLGMLFPFLVDLSELRDHLTIENLDGDSVDYDLEAGEEGAVRIILAEGWPEQLRIRLLEGLRDSSGLMTLKEDRLFAYPREPFYQVGHVQWGKAEGKMREIIIRFTKPVPSDALPGSISLIVEETEASLPFEVVSEGEALEHRIRFEVPGDEFPPLRIHLAAGMEGSQGRILLEDYTDVLETRPDPLQITSVRWGETTGERHTLFLTFSHPVTNDALSPRITLVETATGNALEFAVRGPDLSDNKSIQFRPEQRAEVEVTLAIDAGLPGEPNATLLEPYRHEMIRPAPPLRIEHTWWGWRAGREGLALSMRLNVAVNAKELEAHLEFTPTVEDVRISPEGHGFYQVFGAFRSQTSYQLRIAEGVQYMGGGKSPNTLVHPLQTEQVPAYVGFNHEGKFYFPTRATSALAVESRNANTVGIEIHRMFPSNVAVALEDMAMNVSSDDFWSISQRGRDFVRRWSEELASVELEMPVLADRIVSAPLDLHAIMPQDKRGVFCILARTETGESATKIVLFTDIGVLAHWIDDGIMLFAHNLFSLEPLHRAKVTLHSNKNQLLSIGHTDEQGIVRMANLDTSLGTPAVAVIEHGDDFTLLELTHRRDDTPEILPGMPPYDKDAYDAFIYADRDLYRPGETVRARWIVRTNYGDALAGVPLIVKVLQPNGRVLQTQTTHPSAFGGGSLDIETQKQFPTGKYTIMLTVPGSEEAIGTYQFSLEEFVPNRIETNVELPQTKWLADQAYDIHVEARHLFGAPAADRLASARVAFERKGWSPTGFDGYRFENDSDFTPDTISVGETQTGPDGQASFRFAQAAPPDATSPLTATVFAGVFELGGRAVYGTAEAMYFPSNTCLGIRAAQPEGGTGVEALIAALTPDGTPADLDTATVHLEKQVWNYYVRRYYSHYSSNWTEAFDPVDSKEVELHEGKGSVTFNMDGWGYYRLRVVSDVTTQFSTVTFYAYGDRIRMVSAVRPSLIRLSLDKETYTIGETATLKVESPFDGHGIVTVQGDTLQQMLPVAIENNVGEVRMRVSETHFPNAWLEVTVIHAIETGKTQLHPFSSFALTNLKVHNPARKLTVDFPGLPEEVRPAGQRGFTVRVTDHAGNPAEAEVTLAAVDEGIHDITDYRNPAPYEHFSRSRRPDYRRAHYYDRVAYDFDKPAAGGDALRRLARRSGTADESWIKPVALWSGVLRTGPDGSATVQMDIPEFSGQVRLVAVASTESAAGAGASAVYVRRPYMLRTSLPRFLLPGDAAVSRAIVFNTTDAPCEVELSCTVSGPLQIEGEPKTLRVPANSEASIEIPLRAAETVGQGLIRWRASVKDPQGVQVELLTHETPLPVRTPAAYQSHHELAVVEPGASRTFRNARFLPNEQAELEVIVSANPQLQLYDALKYVVGYPHGCAEQVVSRLMPMYLLRKSQDLIEEVLKDEARIGSYLEEGIARLFAMQTASGGLGHWPGSSEVYPYGSVYALHFLTLVQNDREFDIPAEPMAALQDYARGISNDWTQRETASNLYLRAYATYVLAIGGDINAIHQIRRFDSITLPQPARLLLAAALARTTQDRDRVAMYLSETPSQPYEVTERGGTLNSAIRSTAVEVLAMLDVEPKSPKLHEKARELVRFLSSGRRANTQESALVISALGDYLQMTAVNVEEAAATVSGPSGTQELRGARVFRGKHEGEGGEFTVTNTGEATLFVNITTAGIPEKPQTEAYAEAISIRRRYFTGQGGLYAENTFLQSDSYVVELLIKPEQTTENVVVVDMLPAGFEIENPRLNAETLPPGKFKEAINPNHVDVRDDRIVLAFNSLRRKSEGHTYYYVVRAVTPGTYQAPPATAECMYDASIRGANAVTNIEVNPRQ